MSNKTEWIANRKPTLADAATDGSVLTLIGQRGWDEVIKGELWIPIPTTPRTLEEVAKDILGQWKVMMSRKHLSTAIVDRDLGNLMDELERVMED